MEHDGLFAEAAGLAARLGRILGERGLRMCTAESCTGGLIGALVTEIPGSSAWYDRGFVTYSNEAKTELLGVSPATLAKHGAVSAETAAEMALGAAARSRADIAAAVTGIAGPDGGAPDKPVGTVWLAWRFPDGRAERELRRFPGDRRSVRLRTAAAVFERIIRETERADRGSGNRGGRNGTPAG